MSHSSSEFPADPLLMSHLDCGSQWDLYAIEWPPKVIICTSCGTPLILVGHDPATKRLSYRRA